MNMGIDRDEEARWHMRRCPDPEMTVGSDEDWHCLTCEAEDDQDDSEVPEQPVRVCSSITTRAGHSHLVCTLPVGHPGMHENRGTTWTDDEGESA